MQITETERMMLVTNKQHICGATLKILEFENDPKNALEVKKSIFMILSLLSQISSYTNSKNFDLDKISTFAEKLFKMLNPRTEILEDAVYLQKWRELAVPDLELFCNYVNTIRFDFNSKEGFKLILPKINLNFSIFTKI